MTAIRSDASTGTGTVSNTVKSFIRCEGSSPSQSAINAVCPGGEEGALKAFDRKRFAGSNPVHGANLRCGRSAGGAPAWKAGNLISRHAGSNPVRNAKHPHGVTGNISDFDSEIRGSSPCAGAGFCHTTPVHGLRKNFRSFRGNCGKNPDYRGIRRN